MQAPLTRKGREGSGIFCFLVDFLAFIESWASMQHSQGELGETKARGKDHTHLNRRVKTIEISLKDLPHRTLHSRPSNKNYDTEGQCSALSQSLKNTNHKEKAPRRKTQGHHWKKQPEPEPRVQLSAKSSRGFFGMPSSELHQLSLARSRKTRGPLP